MEQIKAGISYIKENLNPLAGQPEREQEDGCQEAKERLFFELFEPSQGESIANWIIVMRDENSQPKPSQAFIEFVESIVERYQAGEWKDAPAETERAGAFPCTGSEMPIRENPRGVHFLEKKLEPNHGQNQQTLLEELYSEGTLLYAMYPPPEGKIQDHLEKYPNEGFIMAQAIDAYLENATSEEREAFITLIREERTQ